MRIGFLTYGLDRHPTGIGRYAVELLRAMARQHEHVEIVLLATEREDHHGLWDAFERANLSHCYRLPTLLTLGNVAVSAAIQHYRLDIVHDPNGIAPLFGPAWGARRIVTIHDAFAYVYPATHNRLDNWRYRHLLPAAARQADAVLTDSAHSKRDLERYLRLPASQVKAIHCGLSSHFRPIAMEDCKPVLARYRIERPFLLYLGGLNARKNIARLYEAFAHVRQRYPELSLVMGGKRQWQTAEMDAALQRFQLQHAVHYLGYVEDADLPALYSAARLFVFPSLYEGFGLPPLEAMACGTLAVVSNTASLPEVVGDAGLSIDPCDVDALAQAIERGLSDETLRTVLRQRGLKRAAMFTWERAARETLDTYQHIVAQPAEQHSAHRRGGQVLP